MTITQETLTWPFKGPDWKNRFIIGSALFLAVSYVPLIGILAIFVIYGYALGIMRAVMRGEPPTMPAWEKLGELLVDGLKAAGSAIGYMLPGLLAFVCSYLVLFASIFGGTLSAASTPGRTPNPSLGPIFVVGWFGFILLLFIGLALIFIAAIPTPLAVAQYARTGQIGSGYRLGEMWQIFRANVGGFLLAWVVHLGIGSVMSTAILLAYATIILCLALPIILAPIGFYTILMYVNLFGMAYRDGIAKVGLATVS